jgi:uncharacterized protein with von Willebrand factor type A (vWA) domain
MAEAFGVNSQSNRPVAARSVSPADEAGSNSGGHLLGHMLRFGQMLRVMGVDVSTGQVLDLVEALQHVPITDRSDFYTTCQALLVNRREDFLVFDQAFSLFWRADVQGGQDGVPASSAEIKRARLPFKPAFDPAEGKEGEEGQRQQPRDGDQEDQSAARSRRHIYSADEVLRNKDFGEMSWEEIQEAKLAIANLRWNLGERRTRRNRPSSKGRINLRRIVRDNLRHGGEPIKLARRQRVYRPRPLVVLCDISGSMERYSRMLLHFVHALTHGLKDTNVEAFVFGTRLTRITRHLRYKDVDESLDELGDVVRDWSGGTRIGDALKNFNFQWARRVLGRGAVVLVISDGWDRGDLTLLGKEIARLQHATYRLIWLNPLLGSDEYRPVQRGMAMVMPCVDDFLPVHNLVSLEGLAEVLSTVADIRPVRRQRVCMQQPGAKESGAEAPLEAAPAERRAPERDAEWADRVRRRLQTIAPRYRG